MNGGIRATGSERRDPSWGSERRDPSRGSERRDPSGGLRAEGSDQRHPTPSGGI